MTITLTNPCVCAAACNVSRAGGESKVISSPIIIIPPAMATLATWHRDCHRARMLLVDATVRVADAAAGLAPGTQWGVVDRGRVRRAVFALMRACRHFVRAASDEDAAAVQRDAATREAAAAAKPVGPPTPDALPRAPRRTTRLGVLGGGARPTPGERTMDGVVSTLLAAVREVADSMVHVAYDMDGDDTSSPLTPAESLYLFRDGIVRGIDERVRTAGLHLSRLTDVVDAVAKDASDEGSVPRADLPAPYAFLKEAWAHAVPDATARIARHVTTRVLQARGMSASNPTTDNGLDMDENEYELSRFTEDAALALAAPHRPLELHHAAAAFGVAPLYLLSAAVGDLPWVMHTPFDSGQATRTRADRALRALTVEPPRRIDTTLSQGKLPRPHVQSALDYCRARRAILARSMPRGGGGRVAAAAPHADVRATLAPLLGDGGLGLAATPPRDDPAVDAVSRAVADVAQRLAGGADTVDAYVRRYLGDGVGDTTAAVRGTFEIYADVPLARTYPPASILGDAECAAEVARVANDVTETLLGYALLNMLVMYPLTPAGSRFAFTGGLSQRSHSAYAASAETYVLGLRDALPSWLPGAVGALATLFDAGSMGVVAWSQDEEVLPEASRDTMALGALRTAARHALVRRLVARHVAALHRGGGGGGGSTKSAAPFDGRFMVESVVALGRLVVGVPAGGAALLRVLGVPHDMALARDMATALASRPRGFDRDAVARLCRLSGRLAHPALAGPIDMDGLIGPVMALVNYLRLGKRRRHPADMPAFIRESLEAIEKIYAPYAKAVIPNDDSGELPLGSFLLTTAVPNEPIGATIKLMTALVDELPPYVLYNAGAIRFALRDWLSRNNMLRRGDTPTGRTLARPLL